MRSLIEMAEGAGANDAPVPPSDADEELRRLVEETQVRTTIFGCGGGGSNTVGRLAGVGVEGATLVAANSDARHLLNVPSPNKVLLGKLTTKGLGAGAISDVGRRAAEESREEIRPHLDGRQMVFVTAGMGGGTGTGSAPFVAEMARRSGSLVIGVVTMPFKAEGTVRMENAVAGLKKMLHYCDTTITVLNDQLLKLVPKMPLEAAFKLADEVLMQSIKGINETITKPALVNVDFNDISTIMRNGGVAMIGMGESSEPKERVDLAVEEALDSPLLGEIDLATAKGALVRVEGGPDLSVSEAERAAKLVGERVNPRARLIWGCSVEPKLDGLVRVMVVITGVTSPFIRQQGL